MDGYIKVAKIKQRPNRRSEEQETLNIIYFRIKFNKTKHTTFTLQITRESKHFIPPKYNSINIKKKN